MYFIEEGVINILKNNQEEVVLQRGSHFGEMAILQNFRSDHSVFSVTFSIV